MYYRAEIKTKKTIFLAVILASILITSLPAYSSFAQTVGALKDKKTQLQEKLQSINKQIQGYQTEIQATQKAQASLKNEISLYDNQIKTTELQIQAKETQIEDANLQISELQTQIERRIKEIVDNKKILGELIVQLNEMDGNSLLQIGLGQNNFSEFLDQVQYTQNVQNKVYQVVQNIKAIKIKLEGQQTALQTELKQLEELRDQLKITQASLETQRRQKQSLLDKTRGIEKNYQKLLIASKDQEADLLKEIEDLDSSIRNKLGDRTIIPSKGVLAWPMDGILTQRYGNTGFHALGYTFHNGIDLAAPAGQPIYAVADGTIVAADTGEAAYGNWAAIKHTITTKTGSRQIVSLYAHMRTVKVRAGQKVSQGDLVGYEGNTGNTTRILYGPERGYHLHFTIFDAEGFGINPGKYSTIYGPYSVPYGYTYNPLDFL